MDGGSAFQGTAPPSFALQFEEAQPNKPFLLKNLDQRAEPNVQRLRGPVLCTECSGEKECGPRYIVSFEPYGCANRCDLRVARVPVVSSTERTTANSLEVPGVSPRNIWGSVRRKPLYNDNFPQRQRPGTSPCWPSHELPTAETKPKSKSDANQ